MMRTFFLLFALTQTVQSVLYAHGMDKAGPNGGYVQMPGNFHTELLPDVGNKSFKVFLLDENLKPRLIAKATLAAQIERSKEKLEAKCDAAKDHFSCKLADQNLEDGDRVKLSVNTGSSVGIAVYSLPLKFKR